MKLAIIGASTGQLPLCLKAKEMGLKTICFAWEQGAICKDYVDKFYPISVLEKDEILEMCKLEKVNGVVSNASDLLAEITAYLAENLSLNGNPFQILLNIRNKKFVREESNTIKYLNPVRIYQLNETIEYPCIVKPIQGAAKKGVSFVLDESGLEEAVKYTSECDDNILIEQYIEGKEISVEVISYKKKHYILQITDKDNTGAPHFVELGHHQPSQIDDDIKGKIKFVIPELLDKLGYENGASHIEFKIDKSGNLYLIEVNPRGGGDEISACLVQLSTGYDYIKGIIEVALDSFSVPNITQYECSGIYYLCEQSKELFKNILDNNPTWIIEKWIQTLNLTEATGNYDRNGYLIYKWNLPRPLNNKIS